MKVRWNLKAEKTGKTYLVMTIAAGTALKLSISTAVLRVGEDGEVIEVTGPVAHEEAELELKIDGGVLRFGRTLEISLKPLPIGAIVDLIPARSAKRPFAGRHLA